MRQHQRHLLDEPHHDGSALFVAPGQPGLGDRIPVRVRVPRGYGATEVFLRVDRDGNPLYFPARLDRETEHEQWFATELPVDNSRVHYRWLLAGSAGAPQWLTARGVADHEVTDAGDFRVTTYSPGPDWMLDTVGYQIFPDRFARSDAATKRELPAWARAAAWDDDPASGYDSISQVFGGDLAGIAEHIDYLNDLGVNLVYLTPFFPSQSAHRYDATTFDQVDPLLGGDDALARLSDALHRAGIRLIGDLTTNHTGWMHEWFKTARSERSSVERGFYYWKDDLPIPLEPWMRSFSDQWGGSWPAKPSDLELDYIPWLGVPSLPKLNWNSQELKRRMLDGPDSVVGRYLEAPFAMDGWRIDVANMTGRYAADDHHDAVARLTRATVDACNDGTGMLIAEHFFDAARDLDGDGWQAVMNYSGFIRPAWTWLTRADTNLRFLDAPVPIPRRSGAAVARTARHFASLVPWSTTLRQWNMLGSHDTPRIATVTGDRAVTELGAAWLFTYPGIPAFFAGDEGGAVGSNGENARTTMPWEQIAAGGGIRWDARVHDTWRSLVTLRRNHEALSRGGLRWVVTDDDALVYLRETATERILVVLTRAAWSGLTLPKWLSAAKPEQLFAGHAASVPSLLGTETGWELRSDATAVGIWLLH
ncbi:MAG: glycoside hydrolase family 13 protein [Propionibacteriaceae bacterium]|jgi:alpha-glucosidase|nr:glycoside hydrolase family 13 protein [Propionibacteriaceae bacterium]